MAKQKPLTRKEIEETVQQAVRKTIQDTSLKEDKWRDAVKDGVVAALWDVSGYGMIGVFTLMVTGIVVAALLFAVLGYFVLKTVIF